MALRPLNRSPGEPKGGWRFGIDRSRAWTWFANYRGQTGQWAQLVHRLTGLGVALFLLVHIIDTVLLGWGPAVYNAVAGFWTQPWFIGLEILLAGAVIFHAINGIRVAIIDFWDLGSIYQERLFWGVVVISLVLFVPTAVVMASNIWR